MAVDAPIKLLGYWVYLRATMGSTHLNPNSKQIENAYRIRTRLQQQGYNDVSIAGVLANMQVESGLSPGALQGNQTHLNTLPDNGEKLSSLTNTVIQQNWCSSTTYGWGTGLIQWDIRGSTNKIADFAIANNSEWYSGDLQMYKLQTEFEHDNAHPENPYFWFGDYRETWAEFKAYRGTPENAADIFRVNRERGGDDTIQERKDNARWWYDYFSEHPTPPFNKQWMFPILTKRKKVEKVVKRFF